MWCMPSCGGGGKFVWLLSLTPDESESRALSKAEKKESKEIWVLQRDELRLR